MQGGVGGGTGTGTRTAGVGEAVWRGLTDVKVLDCGWKFFLAEVADFGIHSVFLSFGCVQVAIRFSTFTYISVSLAKKAVYFSGDYTPIIVVYYNRKCAIVK